MTVRLSFWHSFLKVFTWARGDTREGPLRDGGADVGE
jgi:hypothetical protein